jgi:predicted alpha/beta superfamily hydrolase
LKRNFGGVENYSKYLVDLKGWVDSNYRTLSEASNTAIVGKFKYEISLKFPGSSHGGLASFYTGCTFSQHFGFIASFSPSFWAGLNIFTNALGISQLEVTTFCSQKLKFKHGSLFTNTIVANLKSESKPKIFLTYGLRRIDGLHNMVIERYVNFVLSY